MVNNKKCPICGKYKKAWYDLCYDCFEKGEETPPLKDLEREENLKNSQHKFKKAEPDSEFPSHSTLYKHLHKFEDELVRYIFQYYDWIFEKKGIFGMKTTNYKFAIEEDNWDLVLYISDTPEPKIKRLLNEKESEDLLPELLIGIEYKSSINEWGKQIDSFFRQIKQRIKKTDCDIHLLFSFDRRFEEYHHACVSAGFGLCVLPKEDLLDEDMT